MLGGNAVGSKNTCSERLRGKQVSHGELADDWRYESYLRGRKRPERGSGSWRACHPHGLQLLQGLGNPKAGGGGGGGAGGRPGGGAKGRGPEGTAARETQGPLEDKPVETVLRVRKQAVNKGQLCSVLCLCSILSHRRGRTG